VKLLEFVPNGYSANLNGKMSESIVVVIWNNYDKQLINLHLASEQLISEEFAKKQKTDISIIVIYSVLLVYQMRHSQM
jgi:flagellar biosynthesis chaperone FliJ